LPWISLRKRIYKAGSNIDVPMQCNRKPLYEQARGTDDTVLLCQAFAEDRILITNDKDFGEKVFRDGLAHKGVVLLRLEDERTGNKIAVMQKLLDGYADRLAGRFVAISELAVRIVGDS
jgi:predicted nuclease of predicted toxin-antitoxin system